LWAPYDNILISNLNKNIEPGFSVSVSTQLSNNWIAICRQVTTTSSEEEILLCDKKTEKFIKTLKNLRKCTVGKINFNN
jgi:hypothetical protein